LTPNAFCYARGQIASPKEHAFYLNVSNNVKGLTFEYENPCGTSNYGSFMFDVKFKAADRVINGTYIVVFTAYANSTDRVSKNVRVHIKVLISELSVLPTSVTMWGEALGIYSLFSERVNWAKLFYSIDNGVNWKTVGMYPCGSDSNWYFGIVPHQIMGTQVQYYVEASDTTGYVEKSPMQKYVVEIQAWVMVFAAGTWFTVMAILIIASRRRHIARPPLPLPPPPPIEEPPPPPPQSTPKQIVKHWRSRFRCDACGQTFWVDEHRIRML
jgi:hypothetical protein